VRLASSPILGRVLAAGLAGAALAGTAWAASVPAGTGVNAGGNAPQPVSIDADQAIEWHQEQKAYVARGNVKVVRGTATLYCDVLVGYYRDVAPPPGATGAAAGTTPAGVQQAKAAPPTAPAPATPSSSNANALTNDNSGTEIYRFAAEGHVHIVSPDQEIWGEHGVYDVDRKLAVVTGDNLKLVTKTDVVTARDSLEYWEDQHLTVARGRAIAVRNLDKVEADLLVGLLVDTGNGNLSMQRIDADGHVVITTPTDVARGDQGIDNLNTDISTLTGHVRLTKGDNEIDGDNAEVNMKTGISRVLRPPAGTKGGERVHALFIPGQDSDKNAAPKTGAVGAAKPVIPTPAVPAPTKAALGTVP
jgi:lipopolysaccharide export system protein LptA